MFQSVYQGVILSVNNKYRTVLLHRNIQAMLELCDEQDKGMLSAKVLLVSHMGERRTLLMQSKNINEVWEEICAEIIVKFWQKRTCLKAEMKNKETETES